MGIFRSEKFANKFMRLNQSDLDFSVCNDATYQMAGLRHSSFWRTSKHCVSCVKTSTTELEKFECSVFFRNCNKFISSKRTGYFIISQKKNPEWDLLVLLQIFCLINAKQRRQLLHDKPDLSISRTESKVRLKVHEKRKISRWKRMKIFLAYQDIFGWDLVNSKLYRFTISISDAQ
jgi:hypothetical protein